MLADNGKINHEMGTLKLRQECFRFKLDCKVFLYVPEEYTRRYLYESHENWYLVR